MPEDRFLAFNIGNVTDLQNGSGTVSRRSFNKGNGAGSSEGVDFPGVLPSALTYAVHHYGTVNDASDTDSGYSIEVAIPWSALLRNPAFEGDWLGINVIVISDDTGGVRDWSDNRSIEPASARFTTPIRPDEYVELKCGSQHSSQSGLYGPINYLVMEFHRNDDTTAPESIANLEAYNARPYSVRLKWSTPAENNAQGGGATEYDIRYATVPITASNFSTAGKWPAKPYVPDSGSLMETRVMGLSPNTAYYFAVQAADEQGNQSAIASVGPYSTTTIAALGTSITESSYAGYVHVSPVGRYFMREDGANFIPVGHHFLFQNDKIRYLFEGEVWTGSTLYDYSSEADAEQTVTNYLDSLKAEGITVMRLFLEDYSLSVKGDGNFNNSNGAYWVEFPKGNYNSDMAEFLVDILRLCSARGIYVIITPFDTFYYDDYFSRTAWASGNGGPLSNINEFFTSTEALAMCKARWTWVINTVSRSGYADMVFGWEVLNEWDSWEWTLANADANTDAAIRADFVGKLAEHIKSLDHEHMILTSTTTLDPRGALAAFNSYTHLFDASLPHLYFPGNREPWNNPAQFLDTAIFKEQSRSISWWTLNQLNRKPVLNGEWGPSDGWMPDPSNPSYFSSFQEEDDELITRRLWFAELAGGAAGPGIRMPGGVRAFSNGLRLSENMLGTAKTLSAFVENGSKQPVFDFTDFSSQKMDGNISISGTAAEIMSSGCTDGKKGLLYLVVDRNVTNVSSGSSTNVTISNLSGSVSQLMVEFWKTDPDQTGPIKKTSASVTGGTVSFLVPGFAEDMAIRFYPLTGTETDVKVLTTGLQITPAGEVEVGDSVTFTANAVNLDSGTIYYRFNLIPDYGTTDYDPFNNWSMIQDFSTANTCSYTFSEATDYIVVAFASATPDLSGDFITIIGGSVTVGDSGAIDIQSLAISPGRLLKVGDTVTFNVSGTSNIRGNVYYRFNIVPHYATDRYDPFSNSEMLRDFSTESTFFYTFDNIGDYVVVVFASSDTSIPSGAAPIIGGVVHVGSP